MPNRFSEVTKKIQDKLPYWFTKMRTDETSVGAQFLNVFGLALEDVEYITNYAYDQTNIKDIDIEQISTVYKFFIPGSINKDYDIFINSVLHICTEVDNLQDFFIGLYNEETNSEVDFPDPFFVDYEKHVIYVRHAYDVDDNYEYGKLTVKISKNENIIFDDIVKLELHPVWNFFDEFGLLLGLKRLRKESNYNFKNRILDVFRYKANSTKDGLINGIAMELGLRRHVTWTNGEYDYIIEDNGVIVNSIEIDGFSNISNMIRYDEINDNIVIKGDIAFTGLTRDITYVYGFNLHELINKDDDILQYQINEPGKPLLEFIKEELKEQAPVFWGNFIWNEAEWDIIGDYTDFIPPRLDGVI